MTQLTLHEALLEVQKEAAALNLPKTKKNPHFHYDYTPLDVVLDRVMPLFHKHGFLVIQSPSVNAAGVGVLRLTLHHVPSDTSWTDEMLLSAGKNDPQGQGAAITYARRYQIMAVLGLTSDDDDDAHTSRAEQTHSGSPSTTTTQSTNGGSGFDAPSGSPF